MQSFETSATVEEEGRVLIAGVPFAPGTEVEVTIKPAETSDGANTEIAAQRAARLFAALNKSRNTEPIGPLRREELYDRKVLR